MNVRVDREMRAKAVAIARVRHEKDGLGTGASVVVRRALARYITRHQDELPDWWEDLL
jgi:hypothetical protein